MKKESIKDNKSVNVLQDTFFEGLTAIDSIGKNKSYMALGCIAPVDKYNFVKCDAKKLVFGTTQLLTEVLPVGTAQHRQHAQAMTEGMQRLYHNSKTLRTGVASALRTANAVLDLEEFYNLVKNDESQERKIIASMLALISKTDFNTATGSCNWWKIHQYFNDKLRFTPGHELENNYGVRQIFKQLTTGDAYIPDCHHARAQLIQTYDLVYQTARSIWPRESLAYLDLEGFYRHVTCLRRLYGSAVIHFVRTGSLDLQLIEKLLSEYTCLVNNVAMQAAMGIEAILERMAKVDWRTCRYVFEDAMYWFFSDELTQNKHCLVSGEYDYMADGDDCPF